MSNTLSGEDQTGIVQFPQQDDWVDYGTIFDAGKNGEWDLYLYGGLVLSALKKDGVYYLYYQGSSGYDPIGDTVTGRAVGVATSTDGINFTKFKNNPILTWSPNEYGEEGIFSTATTLVDDEIYMYYGALTKQNSSKVNSDVRLALSNDGLNFEDKGAVLSFQDETIWGSGDELSPIISFEEAGNWFVYYIPNGVKERHRLGVAWGNAPDNLSQTSMAYSGFRGTYTWSSGGYAKVSPGNYALFYGDLDENYTEARIVSVENPNKLSALVAHYQFDRYLMSTILLDQQTQTWFMYYLDADDTLSIEGERYGVKLAPAGPPDETPPSLPKNVHVYTSANSVKVTWDPALDEDTGIVQYRVYRNGFLWSTVKGLIFETDDSVDPTDWISVTAVNYHGTEGPRSAPVTLGKKASTILVTPK